MFKVTPHPNLTLPVRTIYETVNARGTCLAWLEEESGVSIDTMRRWVATGNARSPKLNHVEAVLNALDKKLVPVDIPRNSL